MTYRINLFYRSATAILSFALFAGTARGQAPDRAPETARQVVERVFGSLPPNVVFAWDADGGEGDYFRVCPTEGKVTIIGPNTVSICRGFYHFITHHGYGQYTWSGKRLDIPETIPDFEGYTVTSPFRHRHYMNVCTFGYTAPYWDYERWERELDWMALHGFDMVLLPIAYEAIISRVLTGMGLTEEELYDYFTAPAHLPWMRMGNMSMLDGGLSPNWFEHSIALQHRILDRMEELGMTPVFNAFAGFVPPGTVKLFPDLPLAETSWQGIFRNWMIDPAHPAFRKIGSAFISEWEKEFGKGKYYLADSFNEMELPFAEKGSGERYTQLSTYGRVLYRSIAEANPDAVWVMQGWMLGDDRDTWDPQSVEALFSEIPDDKFLVIDLSADFNEFVWKNSHTWDYLDGFYGKPWIYSTVPNLGGRSALNGSLDFYANGHLAALDSPNKGALTAYGTAPEGIENNEIVYELIAEAGWSDSRIDIPRFLHHYNIARYGTTTDRLDEFWELLLGSSYGSYTDDSRYRWQIRPFEQRTGKLDLSEDHFRALETFIASADDLSYSHAYMTDLTLYSSLYAAGKADLLLGAIHASYITGDRETALSLETDFLELLGLCDRFLASHPTARLDKWVDYAAGCAADADETMQYEQNARRLISTWGAPDVVDYSCRVWSGMVSGLYLPRWIHYFECAADGSEPDFESLDRLWIESPHVILQPPLQDIVQTAKYMIGKFGNIEKGLHSSEPGILGGWTPADFSGGKSELVFSLDTSHIGDLSQITLSHIRGEGKVRIRNIKILVEWKPVFDRSFDRRIDADNPEFTISVDLPSPTSEPMNAYLYITLEKEGDGCGRVGISYRGDAGRKQ
ncbi:MAG: alpha-N-acetylglucosaminidase [Rikenellaceae bacterium]|nr:alpha-N-acetylglucosaminidase [Rikenellaceae bacterium]